MSPSEVLRSMVSHRAALQCLMCKHAAFCLTVSIAAANRNPNDETFDCPCHGSDFDKYGRLINGPAKADLSPLD